MLDAVRKELETEGYRFYVGTSYRHCLIWSRGQVTPLTPPHDILERKVGEYLPLTRIFAGCRREAMKSCPPIL